MGLFKSKEQKIKEVNTRNKQEIIMLIQNIQLSCKDPNGMSLLRSIQNELQSQGETSEKKVVDIDGELKQLLAEANTYLLKNQSPIAVTKLNKAYNCAVDRHQYCMVGGQMTRADEAAARAARRITNQVTSQRQKTRAEVLQDQLDEENAKLTALQSEFETLKKQHEIDRNNQSIISRARSVQAQITATNTKISNLSVELDKETTDVLVHEIATSNDDLVKGRTFTDTENEVAQSRIIAQNEERQRAQAQTATNRSILGNSAVFGSDPFAEDVFASNAMSDPFGDSVAATRTTSNTQTKQYGDFNASAMGTAEMKRDIERQIRALEDSIEAFNDKIDEANDDLSSVNMELRSLLAKRENASPSDCLALDGQIDQINSRRSGIVYKIKRYRQLVAQQSDKLSLIEKLSTQQDLASTNMKIQELTGGKFADYEGLAMFLNDSVKESNEELENIGTAVSVSESEDVLMSSFSGASAALNDASLTKDEGKYDSLMTELGMPLAH